MCVHVFSNSTKYMEDDNSFFYILLGRIAHGLLVKADRGERSAERHDVFLKSGELWPLASTVSQGLAECLHLAPRVMLDVLRELHATVEEFRNLLEVLLCCSDLSINKYMVQKNKN